MASIQTTVFKMLNHFMKIGMKNIYIMYSYRKWVTVRVYTIILSPKQFHYKILNWLLCFMLFHKKHQHRIKTFFQFLNIIQFNIPSFYCSILIFHSPELSQFAWIRRFHLDSLCSISLTFNLVFYSGKLLRHVKYSGWRMRIYQIWEFYHSNRKFPCLIMYMKRSNWTIFSYQIPDCVNIFLFIYDNLTYSVIRWWMYVFSRDTFFPTCWGQISILNIFPLN